MLRLLLNLNSAISSENTVWLSPVLLLVMVPSRFSLHGLSRLLHMVELTSRHHKSICSETALGSER